MFLKVFQIAFAYGSCNNENFQNITCANKSRNAQAVHVISYTYTDNVSKKHEATPGLTVSFYKYYKFFSNNIAQVIIEMRML